MSTQVRRYFAYGSNLDLEQMARRCPDAVALRPARLPNSKLVFRGGLADVEYAQGQSAFGGVWHVTPECEAALDRYEGFPALYLRRYVAARRGNGGPQRMLFYQMRAQQLYPLAPPSDSYLAGILRGYTAFGATDRDIEALLQAARVKGNMFIGRAARERRETREALAARKTHAGEGGMQ